MPRVTMKLSAKERKEGRDLRDYMVVPIKGAANRRRAGGAAVLVKKTEMKPEKPAKKVKEIPPQFLVCSNDIEAVEDEIEEWDTSVGLEVSKVFDKSKLAEAKKSADGSASGSNVDFVVYEVREIYRAKRGF